MAIALLPLAVAVFVFMLLVAVDIFAQLLGKTIQDSPIGGIPFIGNLVDTIASYWKNAIVNSLSWWRTHFVDWTRALATHLGLHNTHVLTHTRAIQNVNAKANAAAASAGSVAQSWSAYYGNGAYARALNDANGHADALHAVDAADLAQLFNFAAWTQSFAIPNLQASIGAVLAHIDSEVAPAIEARISADEDALRNLFAQAMGLALNLSGVITNVLQPEIVQDAGRITQLEGVTSVTIPQEIGGIRDVVGTWAPAVPTTIAEALAATVAGTAALTTFVDTCGAPMCSWWKPLEKALGNLGHESSGITSLLEGGLLLAFVLAMILEPEPTARDTEDVLNVVITPVVDIIRALF